jgi:hypothetical protein
MTRYRLAVYVLFLATFAAWIGYSAVASAAATTASSAARCIFITESDGTLVAVCGKAGAQ